MHTTLSPTLATDIRPENELLLCCARTRMDSKRADQLRSLLQKDIDWTYLTQMAVRHGVMPLLYFNLNSTCPNAVPKTTLEQFRGYFNANALNNLFLTSELLKLLNLFKDQGISAIPFKGPVLTASIYGNLTLRQFCDLDILVDKQDFFKSRELLISQGYRRWLELEWQEGFVDGNSRVHVDLHQGITPWYFPLQLDFESLWQCLEPVSLAGRTVVTLSPEDLLIILCVQLSRDFWYKREQLIKICDIAELIQVRQTLDWGRVIEQASRLGSTRMLFLSLFLASNLLGAAIPQDVLLKIQADSVVMSLAVEVCDRIFQEADIALDSSESPLRQLPKSAVFYFRLRERLQERLPFVLYLLHLAVIPNERDWAFLPLPAFLSAFYYLLKPIRLVKIYGLKLLQNFLERFIA